MDTSTTSEKLTILPDDFQNELFKQNLNYFKNEKPQLYKAFKSHKCMSFRLCLNPDGSPNIMDMNCMKPLYPITGNRRTLSIIQDTIEKQKSRSVIDSVSLNVEEKHWQLENPIQSKALNKLYESGIFGELELVSHKIVIPEDLVRNFYPLVRVYGVGLGFHIIELLRLKVISYMMIYEPEMDLFYTSLFTLPWETVFKYFELGKKSIKVTIGLPAEDAARENALFINSIFPPLTRIYYAHPHFGTSPKTVELMKLEPVYDNNSRNTLDSGWYEDQKVGLYYSLKNIIKKRKMFDGKKLSVGFRAFIIGSGPSLNESIQYIKSHMDDAIIFSCGSALTPLLAAGIVPDFQVIQERIWHEFNIENLHDPDQLKKINLLKLNVVSTNIDEEYMDVFVFQKNRDPGSSLLGDKFPVTHDVNPTVTNTGISMAAELGANEIFLFGVDYGTPVDSERIHADGTIYDLDKFDDSTAAKKRPFELKGNLGENIISEQIYTWSLHSTEIRISKHPDIKWFNVGEGAYIKGATPTRTCNLPSNLQVSICKTDLINQIKSCFSNDYSVDEIVLSLKNRHMQQIQDYCDVLLDFALSKPQSREEILNTLVLMYRALREGEGKHGFLPTPLLSGGLKQIISNIHTQNSLYSSDEAATRFFTSATEVVQDYIHDILEDIGQLISNIENGIDFEPYTLHRKI